MNKLLCERRQIPCICSPGCIGDAGWSVGKYWNVGLSDPSRLPATQKQLRSLHSLSGRKEDFRGLGLTRGEASDMIEKMSVEVEEKKKEREVTPLKQAFFDGLYRKAIKAANDAGREWSASHCEPVFAIVDEESGTRIPVYGRMGVAYIRWPDRRSAFGRWIKDTHFDGQYEVLPLPHRYAERVEFDLVLVCSAAALKILTEGGVGGLKIVYTVPD
jgi:hypothetical protein